MEEPRRQARRIVVTTAFIVLLLDFPLLAVIYWLVNSGWAQLYELVALALLANVLGLDKPMALMEFLTDWENYRLWHSYVRALAFKVVLFQFPNWFVPGDVHRPGVVRGRARRADDVHVEEERRGGQRPGRARRSRSCSRGCSRCASCSTSSSRSTSSSGSARGS